MCGLMTFGRKQWDHLDLTMRSVLPDTHKTMKDLIPMVDADSDAFNQFMVIYLLICFGEMEADSTFNKFKS
jgi:formiminotetrahydrofolate cyclodeaminase